MTLSRMGGNLESEDSRSAMMDRSGIFMTLEKWVLFACFWRIKGPKVLVFLIQIVESVTLYLMEGRCVKRNRWQSRIRSLSERIDGQKWHFKTLEKWVLFACFCTIKGLKVLVFVIQIAESVTLDLFEGRSVSGMGGNLESEVSRTAMMDWSSILLN